MSNLTAGFERVCITPPAGVPLAGFAARLDVSRGVHDDLFARALVLDDSVNPVCVLSVDVLALPAAFVQQVRTRIAARTGMNPSAMLVACTHTHAAPVTIRTFFNPEETVDAAYMEWLANAMEQAAAAAFERRAPARAGVGTGRVTGLGVNRRTPDGKPVDEEIGILKVEDADGRPRAVLVNYACHPTVLGPDNLLATGDFPATTIQHLEGALGPGSFALYLNGTQGNIGPGHSSEGSAIGIIAPGRTFERAAELGGKLASAVLEALPAVVTAAGLPLGAHSLSVDLPLKAYPPPGVAWERLEEAGRRLSALKPGSEEHNKAKTALLYASIENYYASETAGMNGCLPVELQGVRAGGAAFIGLPAEVFVETGLRIKRGVPHRVFLAGLANGYIGYLPDRASYTAGGYEVVSAKVNEQAEDRLVEGVLELERRLFSKS
ncbi:MAG: neutral/alkaline non-lysosomal ceramidase N-terminal domain-containing protein [Bryobacterales bacterium]|nr:neutral/alkaline non-lysosomal ceramidase N-terminal domain-containing protein [Bryobacterales bacterium]